MSAAPVLIWFRRDLRLGDHPALTAAIASARARGAGVIPVFLADEGVAALGAAPALRLDLSLAALTRDLAALGAPLILRQGPALPALRALIAETGATEVHWSRLPDPDSIARDTAVKADLRASGIAAHSHAGHLLFEPWDVRTGSGGFYRVFTPMWRAVAGREVALPLPPPADWPRPASWPASLSLADLALSARMRRGAAIVAAHNTAGEAAARTRLDAFVAQGLDEYVAARDRPAQAGGTSDLSAHLSLGEISPATVWHAALRAEATGNAGAETFRKELVWREFAWHLLYHTPHIATANWKPDWDAFPWATDPDHPHVTAWKQGRTGIPFVDAAMRQMYVTGRMHNRGRMIVASYLTKHLMTHWKIGLDWFADCLTDWDPASNAMGWQWAAGSGPDAAPYFRVFNPVSQLQKFDPPGLYPRQWIAELSRTPPASALEFFAACPQSWGLSPTAPYPRQPIVSPEAGRTRALAAYSARPRTTDGAS